MPRKVAVTGAQGFLGRHVVDALRRDGQEVVAIGRRPGAGITPADLADGASLEWAFEGADAIVHCAARCSWEGDIHELWRTNVRGTARVLRAAEAVEAKHVVYASSLSCLDLGFSLTGRAGTAPRSTDSWSLTDITTDRRYAITKAAGERLAARWSKRTGVGLTVLRIGPLYGSGDHKMTERYRRILAWPVVVAPTFRVPHVHAGDVADAVVRSVRDFVSGTFELSADPESPYSVLSSIRELTRSATRLVPLPIPGRITFDDRAAREVLGYTNRPLRQGLAEAWGIA